MSQTDCKYCIVGFGIAGQLLLLELLQRGVAGNQICILDETFLGGALATHYGTVLSNTPWWKTRNALLEYSQWSSDVIQQGDTKYQQNECMPVSDIANYCIQTAEKAARANQVCKITARVMAVKTAENSAEKVLEHSYGTVKCSGKLFLTHGAEEKQLEVQLPAIPLWIGLNKQLLSQHVTKEDTVTIFGTSHSGTILLKHLQELGVKTYAVYNTGTPFLFARDGEYDGIKEGSEKIADAILAGEYSNLTLIPWTEPLQLYKALQSTTKVIHSVGFKSRQIQGLELQYDSESGKLTAHEGIYGFGIAFPGTTVKDGKRFTDVSVLSFQEQIRRCLPKILEQ
jgi:hypothetical protein